MTAKQTEGSCAAGAGTGHSGREPSSGSTPSEAREYGAAVVILNDLGITSVKLFDQQPAKSKFLDEAGIHVKETVPLDRGPCR